MTFNGSRRRVVITGMGVITPLGNNVQTYWQALIDGRSGAGPITYFDASAFDTKFACELKGFDPLKYMDRKLAQRADPVYTLWYRCMPGGYEGFGIES